MKLCYLCQEKIEEPEDRRRLDILATRMILCFDCAVATRLYLVNAREANRHEDHKL